MTLHPLLKDAAGIARFAEGPRLRVLLTTPSTNATLRAESDAENGGGSWEMSGGVHGEDQRTNGPTDQGESTELETGNVELETWNVELEAWTWRATIQPVAERVGRWRCDLVVAAATSAEVALTIRLEELGAEPYWLIPATFYDVNRPADAPRRYPRYGFEDDPWTAAAWCFSAERAAAPFASVRTTQHSAALIAESPYWNGAIVGLGLDGAQGTSLLLRYPYAETPRSYAPYRHDDCAPVVTWQPVAAGEQIALSFEIVLDAPAPIYAPLLRDLYDRASAANALQTKPWMPMDAAAALLADGLVRWHYDPETATLAETTAFEHYFRQNERQVDRPTMHVAWLSGIPSAFPLLREGGAAAEAGRRVIDHIAREGLAPCGAFWAQWTPHGWRRCWYGGPDNSSAWIQAATTAEATIFLLRAAAYERAEGRPQPAWEAAALSNLRFVAERQRADGNLGSYYDAHTGEVAIWDGTPGVKWIAPLVEGWHLTGDDHLLRVAERAAAYYEPFVYGDRLRGSPEDVPLGPTSEDGYCALLAYWNLYAATNDQRWLDAARHAADWMLTFRWLYNVRFDPRTFLGHLDFRSVGADLASPSNQHLHTYGLIVLPEQLKLWRATGDDYYFDTARALLGFARQTLARVDGECNARRGMLTEQWYHVDWTHPKGAMLPLAHAWCNGLAIYAFQEAARWGHLWLGQRVWMLEPSALVDADARPERVRLRNPFAEPLTLRVRLLDPWRALRCDDRPLALAADDLGSWAEITLESNMEVTLAPQS
ncbi:MAG TPA: beta-L-arabinofuranosidase domain-containing protein [Herpetosiphonaceae bacterium]